MTTMEKSGYQFAVDSAIECAGDEQAVSFYRGMASGLCLWAAAATAEQWEADKTRIQEACKCAMTKMTEGV